MPKKGRGQSAQKGDFDSDEEERQLSEKMDKMMTDGAGADDSEPKTTGKKGKKKKEKTSKQKFFDDLAADMDSTPDEKIEPPKNVKRGKGKKVIVEEVANDKDEENSGGLEETDEKGGEEHDEQYFGEVDDAPKQDEGTV